MSKRLVCVAAFLLLLVPALQAAARAAESIDEQIDRARQSINNPARHNEGQKLAEAVVANAQASAAQKLAAFDVMLQIYQRARKPTSIVSTAELMLRVLPNQPDAVKQAYFAQAEVLWQWKKYDEAIQKLHEYLARPLDDKPGFAEAWLKLVTYRYSLNQNAECCAEGEKALAAKVLDDAGAAATLWYMQEAAWRAGDFETCRAALDRLTQPKILGQRNVNERFPLQRRLGECLEKLARPDEARAYYMKREKEAADPGQQQVWCMLDADSLAAQGRLDDALNAYERVFTDHADRMSANNVSPDSSSQWQQAQRNIAALLVKKGEYADALKAARICLDASWDQRVLSENVRLVADTLKAIDKNLGRANAFINYQRFGPAGADKKPGTPDDLQDPLAGVGYPAYPQREKAFDAARKAAGVTADASRHRALTYLYTGHPKDALRMFMDAFARAGDNEFARAGQDMILIGARAARGHAVGLEEFVDFVNYGPAGPDGRPGTPDDLKDPFAPLLR